MWIQPNTTVKILSGVPLDNQYENTMWYFDATAQYNSLSRFTKYTFQNPPSALTYQRVNKNTIRINRVADDLYDCNYMMFQNTAYGSKWFYAFITSVNYINDNVTEVVYELDVIQTWLGLIIDGNLEECFIERQHAKDDTIGLNLTPEHVTLGDALYDGYDELFGYTYGAAPNEYHPCIVVAAPFNKTGGNARGTITGGMYSGLYYNIFSDYDNHNMISELNDFFNNVTVQARYDEIVTMFYFIREFATMPNTYDTPNQSFYREDKTVTRDYRGFKDDYSTNESYYVPRNNKLFTAPYNYITVTDWQGHGMDYAYEYFNRDSNIQFSLVSSLSVVPAIGFVPQKYMGNVDALYDENYDYSFWYNDFPRVPWVVDGFIAWLAQTGAALGGMALSYLPQIAMSAVGGLEAAKMNGANAAFNSMIEGANTLKEFPVDVLDENMQVIGQTMGWTNKIAQKRTNYTSNYDMPQMSLHANVQGIMAAGAVQALKGTRIGGNSQVSQNWAVNNIRVSAVHKKIKAEYARRIDKYFDMYGYAQNYVDVPDIHCRQYWTYVKTIGCTLTGELPADDARKIGRIFDSGVRFWTDIDHIGHYKYYENTGNPPLPIS